MKRKKRKGRPRTPATPREPSGRISRTEPAADRSAGVSPGHAKRILDELYLRADDKRLGTSLGRLFIQKQLTSIEYAAGNRWHRVHADYLRALNAPSPHPKTARLVATDGGTPADPDSEAGQEESLRHREDIALFEEAKAVLTDCGRLVEMSVRRLCEGRGEPPAGLESFKRAKAGLNELAKFWRIDK